MGHRRLIRDSIIIINFIIIANSWKRETCPRTNHFMDEGDGFGVLLAVVIKAVLFANLKGYFLIVQDAAKQARCSKQNVSKWTKRFIDMDLIRLQTKDVFKTYSLTPSGQSCFTMSDSNGEVLMLEDQAVKFEIFRNEVSPVDWRKLGEPKNWVKLGTHVNNMRVKKTSKCIIIHPGKMVGYNLEELLFEAGMAVQQVKDTLEVKFGILLSPSGEPLHKPITRFFSEEAKVDVKHGTVIVVNEKGEMVGTEDVSPPEHIPHEEYSGIERTKARILCLILLSS